MTLGRDLPSLCTTPKPVPSLSCRSRMMTSTWFSRAALTAAVSSATDPTSSTCSRLSSVSRRRSASTRESSTSRTRRARMSLLDKAIRKCIGRDVCVRLEVHLFEHAAPVSADGLYRQAQLLGDFRHRAAARELAEDLELTLRELLVNRPVRPAVVDLRDQELRHRGAEVPASRQDHVHGLQQIIRRALLAEEPMRARPQHIDGVLPFRETGQDQHPGVGIARPYVPEDVHAAAIRHADVEDQELPVAFPQPFKGLLAGGRLSNLADRGVLAQQLPQ